MYEKIVAGKVLLVYQQYNIEINIFYHILLVTIYNTSYNKNFTDFKYIKCKHSSHIEAFYINLIFNTNIYTNIIKRRYEYKVRIQK